MEAKNVDNQNSARPGNATFRNRCYAPIKPVHVHLSMKIHDMYIHTHTHRKTVPQFSEVITRPFFYDHASQISGALGKKSLVVKTENLALNAERVRTPRKKATKVLNYSGKG